MEAVVDDHCPLSVALVLAVDVDPPGLDVVRRNLPPKVPAGTCVMTQLCFPQVCLQAAPFLWTTDTSKELHSAAWGCHAVSHEGFPDQMHELAATKTHAGRK